MTRAPNADADGSNTERTRRAVLGTVAGTVVAGTLLGSAAAGTAGAAEPTPADERTGATARTAHERTGATTETATSRRPAVESLTAETDGFLWHSVAADWSVADRDGDLAGVETRLYAGRELLAVEYTDCSGGRASGTHDLDVGWSEDPTRVVLTVVDETKGTNTAEVTV